MVLSTICYFHHPVCEREWKATIKRTVRASEYELWDQILYELCCPKEDNKTSWMCYTNATVRLELSNYSAPIVEVGKESQFLRLSYIFIVKCLQTYFNETVYA